MRLLYCGKCEGDSCPGFDRTPCQLWMLKDERLCWFCWRARLELPLDHDAVAKHYGEEFARMVTAARLAKFRITA